MLPTGDYSTFREQFLSRYCSYGEHETVSFGILLADYRQTESREYILNYLEFFNKNSGSYFDFFIPGYVLSEIANHSNKIKEKDVISVSSTDYVFSEDLFIDFCINLDSQFGIRYPYNPMLIMITMEKCYPRTARYIVIELDAIDGGVRRSGQLFDRIFEIARSDVSLEAFRDKCSFLYIKDDIVTRIVEATGISWLEQINRTGRELRRFRIRELT